MTQLLAEGIRTGKDGHAHPQYLYARVLKVGQFVRHGLRIPLFPLLLRDGLGEIRKGLAPLEFGILNDTWDYIVSHRSCEGCVNLPASASLEKLPLQVTKVWPAWLPEVMG